MTIDVSRSVFIPGHVRTRRGVGVGRGAEVGLEFVKFLEKQLPADQEVHLIHRQLLHTHKSKEVQR
jgi:hypothetical protein